MYNTMYKIRTLARVTFMTQLKNLLLLCYSLTGRKGVKIEDIVSFICFLTLTKCTTSVFWFVWIFWLKL